MGAPPGEANPRLGLDNSVHNPKSRLEGLVLPSIRNCFFGKDRAAHERSTGAVVLWEHLQEGHIPYWDWITQSIIPNPGGRAGAGTSLRNCCFGKDKGEQMGAAAATRPGDSSSEEAICAPASQKNPPSPPDALGGAQEKQEREAAATVAAGNRSLRKRGILFCRKTAQVSPTPPSAWGGSRDRRKGGIETGHVRNKFPNLFSFHVNC